jgi:8-amino-7-oxononanoate synthase
MELAVMDGVGVRFEDELRDRMERIRGEGLCRVLRRVDAGQGPEIEVEGERLLNFSSNDYLGLACHAQLREASLAAVECYGSGSGASRLICGSLAPWHELEARLAEFKGTPAALAFSSGYAAAIGAVTALVGRGDHVVLDRLAHACLVDAARLSGARLRVFEHNNPESLERVLRWIRSRHGRAGGADPGRVLVITESVFSMDGDTAPLRSLVELKERYGAWLLVDEAHATGLYGGLRRGLVDEYGLGDRVEVQLGTLGKAVGAAGGYVVGPAILVEFLVNRSRTFIFSTAPVPAAAAAARAGIEVIQSAEGRVRCDRLWERVHQVRETVGAAGFDLPSAQSPIIPLRVGEERRAMAWSAALRTEGIHIPAVRYPTVARGAARLRLTVSSGHTPAQVERLGVGLMAARRAVERSCDA